MLDLFNHPAHQVDWNRETDAFGSGVLRQDGRVDADELAAAVDERTPGVAGIDGRVGLDEVLESHQLVESRDPWR